MTSWIALIISLIALGISIKAFLESRWIEIDWSLDDDDE